MKFRLQSRNGYGRNAHRFQQSETRFGGICNGSPPGEIQVGAAPASAGWPPQRGAGAGFGREELGVAQASRTSRKDRVWFITGCSTGFGEALAREVLEQGERVVATARRPEAVQHFERDFPQRAIALALDVTQPRNVDATVRKALEQAGHIDVLVNNAGFGVVGAVEEVSDAEARQIFETNVMGLLNVTRAVLPHMRQRRSGHIVNVSSMTGLFAPPGFGFYSGTKFAVEGLTEAMAAEVRPLGIRVTLIEPGPFRTNFRGGLLIAKASLPDYEQTVGPVRKTMAQPGGTQPGDPQRAARLIVEVVNSDHPPLRLPMGEIAIQNIRNKLAAVAKDIEEWEPAARATSFPQ
jgi:NAD(P)-dependent dehydrogenase (short-subunit alcohol dehydrogenase family)